MSVLYQKLRLFSVHLYNTRSFIGSYVIQWFSPFLTPQIRFNCLNKPVSPHPSLYSTQVRPYLFTSLSEGLRPPSVLPMRSCDASLALRCFRTCGKAPVQPTASFTGERRFLARGAHASDCQTKVFDYIIP